MKKRSGKTAGVKSRTRVRPEAPPNSSTIRAVFLVGFMGAGKTSVGRALGQRLNWLFEDLDDRIVRREGRSVPDIFRDSGEPEFRRVEHEALRELLNGSAGACPEQTRNVRPAVARASGLRIAGQVIALGGGAFVQPKNAALLKSAGVSTVFLDASSDELWRRCCQQAGEGGAERPLLRSPEQFRKLYNERRKGYSKAGMTVQTSNRSIDEIAAEIVHKLGLDQIPVRIEQGEVE